MSHANNQDLIHRASKVLLQNYRQQPMVLTRGEGVQVWDVDDRRYLDMTAGIAVCALGHSHPALTEALSAQAGRLLHVSNLYFVEQQILAAEAIAARSFADRVFFCNSGAEANEAALKLARRYQHVIAGKPERNTFVSTTGSFHGRSFATVSITGQAKYREGFGPLVGPVEFVPYGDLAAAERVLSGRTACAFIVEPVQAEGGIVVPPPGYLAGLRKLADETETILIFDEVQTGVGRCGEWFGHQVDGVTPDVMTLAKALGGGVPIGAIAATEKAAAGLSFQAPGAVPHASTFGGNAFSCAAAKTVIEVIEREGLLANCREVGGYLGERLEAIASAHPDATDGTRGRGLLRGLAVKDDAAGVVAACRERGVLLSIAGGNVIRFAPPLNLTRDHVDEATMVLGKVIAGR